MRGDGMGSRQATAVLIALLLGGMLLTNLMWFQPATLLPVIAGELDMSYGQSGLSVSVICLLAAAAGPFAGVVLNRAGLKNTFTAAVLFIAAGSVGSLVSVNFYVLLLMRVLVGVGIGISIPAPGVAAMSWLGEKQRPLLNSVYAILPYIATALNFGVSVKLFNALGGDWKLTLAIPGFMAFAVTVVWAIQDHTGYAKPETKHEGSPGIKDIGGVLRNRQVRLICLAEACDMWGFEFLSSYIVTYLSESGMTLEKAAALSTMFPVAGIIAGTVCGALMTVSGKRKIFTWPMHLAIFTGTLMIVFGGGFVRLCGIFLAGFGNAGWAPALYTMPMEFIGMTAEKISLVFSVLFSMGFLAAFISPPVGGRVAEMIGLKYTMAIYASFALFAAIFTFSMDETHPGIEPGA